MSGNKANETGDPYLKRRSFSQTQILFQQFCFHEVRLTDNMFYCTKSHNFIVLQISRLPEGSSGQIFATSSVIYQMKMLGL